MPRQAKGLTEETVRTSKPGRYGDGGGLYLLVRGPEARSWLFRYTRAGKMTELGLGPARGPSGVSLVEARMKARKLHDIVREGRDPLPERAAALEAQVPPAKMTANRQMPRRATVDPNTAAHETSSRTRKALDRPADVPSDVRKLNWSRRPFEPTDIPSLIHSMRTDSREPQVDANKIAKDLTSAFQDYVMMSHLFPAPGQLLQWLDAIEDAAATLLNLLGFSAELWASGRGSVRAINQWPALELLRKGAAHGTGPFPAGIPADARRALGEGRFRRALERVPDMGESGNSPEARLRALGREATDILVPLAPRVMGLLMALARGAKAPERPRSIRGGRPPDPDRNELFRRLVLVHRDIFGAFPETHDKVGGRVVDSPSVRWVWHIINFAWQRLSREEDTGIIAGAARLADVMNLSDVTFVDLVVKGNTAARRSLRGN